MSPPVIHAPKMNSVHSWSDAESSLDSFHMLDSPDATTISTNSNRSSLLLAYESSGQLHMAGSDLTHNAPSWDAAGRKHGSPPGHLEFVALQQELARFTSKTGPSKANILRLTLLPFLRRRLFEALPNSSEITFRVAVLESWWMKLLADTQAKDHTTMVAGSDRAAYYEAISGIMARPEWLSCPDSYSTILADTVAALLPKLAVPSLPVALGAFAGKVLAYAFYYSPDIAPVLVYLLRPKQQAVDRLVVRTRVSSSEPPLDSMYSMFPGHVKSLVGLKQVIKLRPDAPKVFGDLYGPWGRHWSPASGIFASFLKHYYSLLANLLPPETDSWLHAHLAAPGLFLIQGAIVSYLDCVVQNQVYQQSRSNRGSRMGSPNNSPDSSRRTSLIGLASLTEPSDTPLSTPPAVGNVSSAAPAGSPTTPVPGPRVDRLRLFSCLREILHNDNSCVPYYRPFSLQFDRMIQTVAASVSVYQMNSCVKLCDVVEEWISCVTLVHRKSENIALVNRAGAVDWDFWAHVASRMISSDNCYNEVRALSLLFNIWPHMPQNAASDDAQSAESLLTSSSLASGLDPVYDMVFIPKTDNLLWDVTEWILSSALWDKYFCHWNPLVRSYYHRLLCFRVASVGTSSEWICDYDSAQYFTHSRTLLEQRLSETAGRCAALGIQSSVNPSTMPSTPVPNRRFVVGHNAAAQAQLPQTELHRVYLFDIFDNAAYYSDARAKEEVMIAPSIAPSIISNASSEVGTPGSPTPSIEPAKTTPSPKPSSLNRTLSIFKKLLPSDQDSSRNSSEVSSSRSSIKSSKKSKRKASGKGMAFADPKAIPSPWQLKEARPEIQRPSYRFSLVPTDRVLQETGEMCAPYLPYNSRPLTVEPSTLIDDGNSETCDKDLTYWNYGFRSLHEWNDTVVLFEDYVSKLPIEAKSIDKLLMPFMVAEIPWRTVA